MTKRGRNDFDEYIAQCVGENLQITKKAKPPGNSSFMTSLAYDALYRDNVRLKSELKSQDERIFNLENQLREVKRAYDELNGRHTFVCRELTPVGLAPTHEMMYVNGLPRVGT
jgi:DNA-directed RNA polymerase specialized sigma subunit